MAGGNVRVNGTNYDIVGGRCLVDGTGYSIKKGIVNVGGTTYRIYLGATANVIVQLMAKRNPDCYLDIFLNDLYYRTVNGGEFEARTVWVKAHIGDKIKVIPYLANYLSCDGFTDIVIATGDIFTATVSQQYGVEINYTV